MKARIVDQLAATLAGMLIGIALMAVLFYALAGPAWETLP